MRPGGAKCEYFNCGNTRRNSIARLFRFPVKLKDICEQWIVNCGKFRFFTSIFQKKNGLNIGMKLPEILLKETVFCKILLVCNW